MRGAGPVTLQIVGSALLVAVVGGLIGLLIGHFVGSGNALNGFAWGMVIGGAVVGLAVGGSGSPTDNIYRGKVGAFATYWGESSPLPQSPLQLALGAILTFAVGVGLLILGYQ